MVHLTSRHHGCRSGVHITVNYDDGDVEKLELSRERYKLLPDATTAKKEDKSPEDDEQGQQKQQVKEQHGQQSAADTRINMKFKLLNKVRTLLDSSTSACVFTYLTCHCKRLLYPAALYRA